MDGEDSHQGLIIIHFCLPSVPSTLSLIIPSPSLPPSLPRYLILRYCTLGGPMRSPHTILIYLIRLGGREGGRRGGEILEGRDCCINRALAVPCSLHPSLPLSPSPSLLSLSSRPSLAALLLSKSNSCNQIIYTPPSLPPSLPSQRRSRLRLC